MKWLFIEFILFLQCLTSTLSAWKTYFNLAPGLNNRYFTYVWKDSFDVLLSLDVESQKNLIENKLIYFIPVFDEGRVWYGFPKCLFDQKEWKIILQLHSKDIFGKQEQKIPLDSKKLIGTSLRLIKRVSQILDKLTELNLLMVVGFRLEPIFTAASRKESHF
jgi:hypothetical protein